MKRHLPLLVLVLTCTYLVHGAGVEFGVLNLGYQEQDAFCPTRVGVDDISSYVARLREVCISHFAKQDKPNAFDIVVLVHREHAHVWFVGKKTGLIPEAKTLEEALRRVSTPRLNRGPIAFSVEAKIGGDSIKRVPFSLPPVPEEWGQALAKCSLPQPVAFDDFVDTLCPP